MSGPSSACHDSWAAAAWCGVGELGREETDPTLASSKGNVEVVDPGPVRRGCRSGGLWFYGFVG